MTGAPGISGQTMLRQTAQRLNIAAELGGPRKASNAGGSRGHCGDADDNSTQLTGLIFDMAGVLYDGTVWRRWLWQLLLRLGIQADFCTFYAAWERDYLVDVQCGRREFTEALQDFLAANGLTWAQIDEIEAASRLRREGTDHATRPLPGVAATLRRLSGEGLSLAVLTDSVSPVAFLENQLDRLGLGGIFQAIVSSVDLGATTPAAECYAAALATLNMSAVKVAYVGHRVHSLAGATAAGIGTIAFNQEAGARSDIAITHFFELMAAVTEWGLRASERPRSAPLSDCQRRPA